MTIFTTLLQAETTENVAEKIPNDTGWFVQFIQDNPSIILSIVTGLLLPLGLVWLNNRNNVRIKKLENKLNLDSKKLDKELSEEIDKKGIIQNQERVVYSSLSKILFDVQQLHVSLSGTCIDKNCIDNSLEKFDKSIIKYHEEIANNMLYMSSKVINYIYEFYSIISDLKVNLKEFNDIQEFQMAHVSVYMHSIELSEVLIKIQEEFISKDEKLKSDFDESAQEMMKYCCGRKPPQEEFEKFKELFKKVNPNYTEDEIYQLDRRYG
ncbi:MULTISPECIES: hypothetical protein [Flavobacteriaceae]|uniref:Uncharacterized protein n=1 Tax=Psychroflexus halocasei TaxID=908615 RepID=A0A1H4E0A1_9FLAO|nr:MULTISPECIES: hypothetical protein [Flavobacteriaceae]MDS1298709.1 hypothetical protein [Aequorivita sp. S2608]SEA78199.1 hypothetical protein SAMN05421540_1204 [Psychroflexus halocasei]